MGLDRNAATIIRDRDRVVREEFNGDVLGVTGHRFVDGVVHHLPHEMVQAVRAGRTDVHARSQPDGLKTLENGDIACSVASGPLTFLGHRGILSVEIQAF